MFSQPTGIWLPWRSLTCAHSDAWKMRDFVHAICQYLIAFTFLGSLLGRGQGRGTLCAAGVLGWFLWVTTSIGVL
jgi:hypothetical protein